MNYSPIVTHRCACCCSRIWWHASAKKWFNGPIQNIDPTVAEVYEA